MVSSAFLHEITVDSRCTSGRNSHALQNSLKDGTLGCHECVTIISKTSICVSHMRDNRLRGSARASRICDNRPVSVNTGTDKESAYT